MNDTNAEQMRLRLSKALKKLTESSIDFYANLGIWDVRDLYDDADGFGVGYPWGLLPPYYRLSQKRGEVLPVYLNEVGLRFIRDRIRRLCYENEFAVCALANRQNYIIGKGLTYRAVPARDDCPPELLKKVQTVLDAFRDYNSLPQYERAAMLRLDKDGESITRLFPDEKYGLLAIREVEPEHLRSPLGDSYGPHYDFGIETPPDDVATKLAFWIVERPIANWQPTRVPADEIVYLKLNTDADSKRGLPTFYPVEANLKRARELLASMTSMAKARAKIAMIRKFSGIAQATAASLQAGLTAYAATDPSTGTSVNLEQLRYGTILNSSKDIDYEFPAADADGEQFVTFLQAELRAIAARLCMPEWMLSSDASNANLASSLIAEAPSTKNFEALQGLFVHHFGESVHPNNRSLMWRQIRYSVRLGVLPRETLQLVKIQAEAPSLVVRDKAQEATVNQTYCGMRVKSPQTIQQELGLDTKQEVNNFRELGIDPARPEPTALASRARMDGEDRDQQHTPDVKETLAALTAGFKVLSEAVAVLAEKSSKQTSGQVQNGRGEELETGS